MNVVVLIKQVPDTEARIAVGSGARDINRDGLSYVVNPYDEYAIEEALRVKEKFGGTVTVVTMGPDRAIEAVRTALAMGVDDAVHLKDPAFEGSDPHAAAKALAAAVKGVQYDLILCGKQAIDDDSAQVGPIVAEMLGLPQVTTVTSLELDPAAGKARAKREVDGAAEVVETGLPAVITAQKGLNEPRFPSLPGIMKAKKKEIKVLDAAGLGLGPDDVGDKGSFVNVRELSVPSRARAGRIIRADPPAAAAELAKLLSQDAKVI